MVFGLSTLWEGLHYGQGRKCDSQLLRQPSRWSHPSGEPVKIILVIMIIIIFRIIIVICSAPSSVDNILQVIILSPTKTAFIAWLSIIKSLITLLIWPVRQSVELRRWLYQWLLARTPLQTCLGPSLDCSTLQEHQDYYIILLVILGRSCNSCMMWMFIIAFKAAKYLPQKCR